MKGKKPDEEIREPFLWDVKANDECRTTWMTPKNSTEQTVAPVAVQEQDQASILNHYKSLIKLRNNSAALTYGTIEPVTLENKAISAFVRAHQGESVLVLHNLSGSSATINLPTEVQNYKTTTFQLNNAEKVNKSVVLPAYSSLVLKK